MNNTRGGKVANKIVITVLDNGDIGVDGFPARLSLALSIMHQAEMAIFDYFLNHKEDRIVRLN